MGRLFNAISLQILNRLFFFISCEMSYIIGKDRGVVSLVSTEVLNSEISFSLTSCYARLEGPSTLLFNAQLVLR